MFLDFCIYEPLTFSNIALHYTNSELMSLRLRYQRCKKDFCKFKCIQFSRDNLEKQQQQYFVDK